MKDQFNEFMDSLVEINRNHDTAIAQKIGEIYKLKEENHKLEQFKIQVESTQTFTSNFTKGINPDEYNELSCKFQNSEKLIAELQGQLKIINEKLRETGHSVTMKT